MATGSGSLYVLGPFIGQVMEDEPDAAAPTPPAMVGRQGVEFHPTSPTKSGNAKLGQPAVATVRLAARAVDSDVRPTHVHAVYVQPPESVPVVADRLPEWFLNHPTASKGSLPVPQPPLDASGDLAISVPGVKSGWNFLQIILEFAA